MEDERRWFRVNLVAVRRSGQRLGGKVMWQADKTERKWFFPVRMVLSARLARWFWGGTY
jgi:hypothetical protein